MSLSPTTLMSVLRAMQGAINDAAAAADTELPERQYVTTGGAVYDCEQVTVSANSVSVGLAGAEGGAGQVANCGPGWNVTLELAIVRKACEAPTGRRGEKPPTVDCIEKDTEQASIDLSILTAGVTAVAGPGWDQYGNVPASILFGEVQGGLFAAVLTATLNMWDFTPDEPAP